MSSKEENKEIPIIVKRIKKVEGHHGGSWKVAFADFAVAMMAFFLLMWLLGGTSDEEKKEIAGYFQHPEDYVPIYKLPVNLSLINFPTLVPLPENNAQLPVEKEAENHKKINSEKIENELSEQIEKIELQQLKESLEQELSASKYLLNFKDQMQLSTIPEGLRLQLVDDSKNPMFDPGKSKLNQNAFKILVKLAPILNTVPNLISITGHTDLGTLNNTHDYSNWELSVDRANDARRALEEGGLNLDKIARISGLGSTVLFDAKDPEGPANRRVSIIILKKDVGKTIRNEFFDNKKSIS